MEYVEYCFLCAANEWGNFWNSFIFLISPEYDLFSQLLGNLRSHAAVTCHKLVVLRDKHLLQLLRVPQLNFIMQNPVNSTWSVIEQSNFGAFKRDNLWHILHFYRILTCLAGIHLATLSDSISFKEKLGLDTEYLPVSTVKATWAYTTPLQCYKNDMLDFALPG